MIKLHFLNDFANDAELTQKSIITPISELTCKLINRTIGSRFFDIKFTRLGFENACRIAW